MTISALAAPTLPAMSESLREAIEAEKRLAERLPNFAGEWVAVRAHEVVAHAESLAELLKTADRDEVVVFQVPTEPEAVWSF